jgi:hypothetical protein
MKRIISNTVTETLMKVLENADDVDQIVILCRHKGLEDTDNAHYSIQHNEDLTLESVNWLIDTYKAWLFSYYKKINED